MFVVNHNVVWLDVSVHDAHTVTVVQGLWVGTERRDESRNSWELARVNEDTEAESCAKGKKWHGVQMNNRSHVLQPIKQGQWPCQSSLWLH